VQPVHFPAINGGSGRTCTYACPPPPMGLYYLSYATITGSGRRNRTLALLVTKEMLYRLSYTGIIIDDNLNGGLEDAVKPPSLRAQSAQQSHHALIADYSTTILMASCKYKLVCMVGFEPTTSCPQSRRSTKLNYTQITFWAGFSPAVIYKPR
jgi:hypothetical protein